MPEDTVKHGCQGAAYVAGDGFLSVTLRCATEGGARVGVRGTAWCGVQTYLNCSGCGSGVAMRVGSAHRLGRKNKPVRESGVGRSLSFGNELGARCPPGRGAQGMKVRGAGRPMSVQRRRYHERLCSVRTATKAEAAGLYGAVE